MRYSDLKIRTKLLVVGVAFSVISLLKIIMTGFSQNRKVLETGEEGTLRLAYSDLGHIVDNFYTLAESHQEVTQKT